MKKVMFLLTIFLFMPVLVHAANLTVGINVDGIGDLQLTKQTYNLTLFTKLNYSDIVVTTADGCTVTMTVDGNPVEGSRVPVTEGTNVIQIAVSNGSSTENWTINLNVDQTTEIDSDNPPTGAFISIIELMGVVLVGIVFYLYSSKHLMKKI